MSFDIGKYFKVRIPRLKKSILVKKNAKLQHFSLFFKFVQLDVIDRVFLTYLFSAPFIPATGLKVA